MELGWNVCWDFQHQRFAAQAPEGGWKQKSTSSYSKQSGGWQGGGQQIGEWGVAQLEEWPGAWGPGGLPPDQQFAWPVPVAASPFGGDGPFSGDAAGDDGGGGPKGRGRGRGKGRGGGGAEWWQEGGDDQWGGNSWSPWNSAGKGKSDGWIENNDQWGGKNSVKAGGKAGQQGRGKGGAKGGGKPSDETPDWWPGAWNDGAKGAMVARSGGKGGHGSGATPPPPPAVQPAKSSEKKDDVNSEVDALLAIEGGGLQRSDFDFRVRRFLQELHKAGGRVKVRDALAMVQEYTQHKSREAVKNWPAYLLTLMKKFEPDLAAEGHGGRAEKGRGKGGGGQKSTGAKEARPAEPKQVPNSAPVAKPPKKSPEKPEVVEAPREEEPYASDDEAGRAELVGDIRGFLGAISGPLTCPWTEQELDDDTAIATHYASCLGACTSGGGHGVVAQHLEGLARDQHLSRYPQAASTIRAAGGMEFLSSSSSLLEVTTAARKHAGKIPSTALEDLALALTAEVLRNWELCPSEKASAMGELLEAN